MTTATASNRRALDVAELEDKVKAMYREVATNPSGEFHFEMGRSLTERLGYRTDDLDAIPQEAIASFAGVGYYFDLAALSAGEKVVDLGSGSGTDSLIAARHVGPTGTVVGIDFTDEQLAKAESLRRAAGFDHVSYRKGRIDDTRLDGGAWDAVISNGVVNLAPDKDAVFREAARLLRPGGRLALSDIVTGVRLPEGITCNATLWAACIGGAMQIDDYLEAIGLAGFDVRVVRDNTAYRFLSDSAQGATARFGVKSMSILAVLSADGGV